MQPAKGIRENSVTQGCQEAQIHKKYMFGKRGGLWPRESAGDSDTSQKGSETEGLLLFAKLFKIGVIDVFLRK